LLLSNVNEHRALVTVTGLVTADQVMGEFKFVALQGLK
jgi:hypothetical protein